MSNQNTFVETPCIVWTGALTGPGGYGQRRVNGKVWTAHRFAYAQKHGPIPDGLFVCHRCNNKPCVNVDHLYLATHRQNILDAYRDGLLRNQNTWKTACSHCGGPYSMAKNRRYCKECKKASNRRTKKARRALRCAMSAQTQG